MINKTVIGYGRNHILPYDEWGFWKYPEGQAPLPERIDDDLGKKLYVRHIETESLVIVTYMNHELDDEERAAILEEAQLWLKGKL
jgi:hypothetical protein